MTTPSESTDYLYRAFCDAGVEHDVAHNASGQVLNLAGRNIIDHVDNRFTTLEKDIASHGEAVRKDIARLEKDIASHGEAVRKDIARLEKDIASHGEAVHKDITHNTEALRNDIASHGEIIATHTRYATWHMSLHAVLVVGILGALFVNMSN